MAAIGIGCSAILMGSLYSLRAQSRGGEIRHVSHPCSSALAHSGNLLGTTPLALAVELFGWRWSMVGITAITALSTLLAFLVLRDPERIDSSDGSGGMIDGLVEIVSLRTLWLILPITFVSYAVVIATRSLWIAPFFSQVHGLQRHRHRECGTADGDHQCRSARSPTVRSSASSVDAKRTAVIGSAVTAAAYLALAGFGAQSAAASVALIGLIGGAGLTYGIIMAHARLFFPRHLIGRGVTFMNFIFISGAGIIQWISGQFINASERAGLDAGERYATLYGAFGLLVAAAFGAVSVRIGATGTAGPAISHRCYNINFLADTNRILALIRKSRSTRPHKASMPQRGEVDHVHTLRDGERQAPDDEPAGSVSPRGHRQRRGSGRNERHHGRHAGCAGPGGDARRGHDARAVPGVFRPISASSNSSWRRSSPGMNTCSTST